MTTNDFDRTARLWLEDGPTELSDRALQAALDEIHVSTQRRPWWPARRLSSMSNVVRLVAGVAAVVVVVLVGINLIAPSNGGIGGPAPSPTPTATPAPTPTLSPSPSLGALTLASNPVALEAGTYVTPDPFGSRVMFSVPAGWSGNVGGPYLVELLGASGQGGLNFSIFENVYADPCHADKGLLDPLPGPSAADLATALAKVPGLVASAPTDINWGGYKGKQLTLAAPASFTACTLTPDGAFRVWELPLGATNDMTPGQRDRVWILDVDGTRLVIDAPEKPGQSGQAKAEVDVILNSIQIAPLKSPTPKAS
jgi:hypothetical protein